MKGIFFNQMKSNNCKVPKRTYWRYFSSIFKLLVNVFNHWRHQICLYYIFPRRNVSTQHVWGFFPPADFVAWTSNTVTSSPRETQRTCEEQCCAHTCTVGLFTFKGVYSTYCHLMIVDSRSMESLEEEALLGEESEEENSELSDNEVSELFSC